MSITQDPLLAALRDADRADREMLLELRAKKWPMERLKRYRLQGYSARRLAALAGVRASVIAACLQREGLL